MWPQIPVQVLCLCGVEWLCRQTPEGFIEIEAFETIFDKKLVFSKEQKKKNTKNLFQVKRFITWEKPRVTEHRRGGSQRETQRYWAGPGEVFVCHVENLSTLYNVESHQAYWVAGDVSGCVLGRQICKRRGVCGLAFRSGLLIKDEEDT